MTVFYFTLTVNGCDILHFLKEIFGCKISTLCIYDMNAISNETCYKVFMKNIRVICSLQLS